VRKCVLPPGDNPTAVNKYIISYHISYHRKVKPEAATAVVELMMISVRTSETCLAINKRQDNKLEKLLHLVGDLFEFGEVKCVLVCTRAPAMLYE
jgi:hypothetical protein